MFLFKSRRGITPVLSTIILVGATIISFSLILAFTNQWLKISRFYDVEGVYERIIIEDIWFSPLQGNRVIRLTVTNVGKIDVEIILISIFIKDNNALVKSYNPQVHLYVICEPVPIDIILDSPWTPNTTYRIEIVTSRWNRFEVICKSP